MRNGTGLVAQAEARARTRAGLGKTWMGSLGGFVPTDSQGSPSESPATKPDHSTVQSSPSKVTAPQSQTEALDGIAFHSLIASSRAVGRSVIARGLWSCNFGRCHPRTRHGNVRFAWNQSSLSGHSGANIAHLNRMMLEFRILPSAWLLELQCSASISRSTAQAPIVSSQSAQSHGCGPLHTEPRVVSRLDSIAYETTGNSGCVSVIIVRRRVDCILPRSG